MTTCFSLGSVISDNCGRCVSLPVLWRVVWSLGLVAGLGLLPPATVALNAAQDDSQYSLGADSQRQAGVPEGLILQRTLLSSEVFPDTRRYYSIYVPAQYDPEKPACLMVFQDGHAYEDVNGQFRVPVVFDNLIHKGEMPVTIAVFVDPGHKQPELPPRRGWRPEPANRSFEYDTLSGDYAKFLLEELLPEVERDYRLSADPQHRAIGGISSGGICAFTVAWQRPDAFGKVLSHVGSFVDIRGGHE